jgi:hypothetical protein
VFERIRWGAAGSAPCQPDRPRTVSSAVGGCAVRCAGSGRSAPVCTAPVAVSGHLWITLLTGCRSCTRTPTRPDPARPTSRGTRWPTAACSARP